MPHLLDSQASPARLHNLIATIPNNPRETALPDFLCSSMASAASSQKPRNALDAVALSAGGLRPLLG